ncbi:MAG: hypothetical protein E3K32_13890 [wastewater metagenome]|nr:hypothetical protein [Candidatus Loosdrechtia aerotolerans]
MKKGLLIAAGIFSTFVILTQSVFAAWDKPCDKRQILEAYWCDTCNEVREFNECSEIGYIWDFEKHKGEGDKTHTDLPPCWGCQKVAYSCINPDCKKYGVCLPAPGACEECFDDITSTKVWSRVLFKCPKCGQDHAEPGKGFTTKKGRHPAQIETAGECETCSVPLEIVCTKSGTCPHVSR